MPLLRWTNDDAVGFVLFMLNDDNPKSAQEQLDDGYQHGGGFTPFKGHTLHLNESGYSLSYPGDDDPTLEVSRTKLRDETIVMFEHAWVAIIQPDGTYVIARMD